MKEALLELSGRLSLPYILDDSVPTDVLERPIRLTARHLTGQQTLRWLARMVDLEAVVVEGTVLLAPAERLPQTWRLTGTGDAPPRNSDLERWQTTLNQSISVQWMDVPLSRVARDLEEQMGFDVIFAPSVLEQGDLIRLEEPKITVEATIRHLSEILNVRADFMDGALWFHSGREPIFRAPARSTTVPTVPDSGPAEGMDRMIQLDESLSSWSALADRLAEKLGARPQIEIPAGTGAPDIQAAGSIDDILEAGQLMGWFVWHLGPLPDSDRPVLNIRVRKTEK